MRCQFNSNNSFGLFSLNSPKSKPDTTVKCHQRNRRSNWSDKKMHRSNDAEREKESQQMVDKWKKWHQYDGGIFRKSKQHLKEKKKKVETKLSFNIRGMKIKQKKIECWLPHLIVSLLEMAASFFFSEKEKRKNVETSASFEGDSQVPKRPVVIITFYFVVMRKICVRLHTTKRICLSIEKNILTVALCSMHFVLLLLFFILFLWITIIFQVVMFTWRGVCRFNANQCNKKRKGLNEK